MKTSDILTLALMDYILVTTSDPELGNLGICPFILRVGSKHGLIADIKAQQLVSRIETALDGCAHVNMWLWRNNIDFRKTVIRLTPPVPGKDMKQTQNYRDMRALMITYRRAWFEELIAQYKAEGD